MTWCWWRDESEVIQVGQGLHRKIKIVLMGGEVMA